MYQKQLCNKHQAKSTLFLQLFLISLSRLAQPLGGVHQGLLQSQPRLLLCCLLCYVMLSHLFDNGVLLVQYVKVLHLGDKKK